jgi:membrane associated rhomboid family serine protease
MMNLSITDAVKQLLIINVLFYIGSLIVGEPAYDILALYLPENTNFQFWQPLTYMFMHAKTPMHILFNMFSLYSFGVLLERLWGTKKFLFFYISCGLGAAALHIAISYFSFNHGMEILTSNGFSRESILQLLNEGKLDTRWQEIMSSAQLSDFIGSYISPTVGASGAIYGLLVAFAVIAPNAELALLFIPVPIKAKYFVPGLLALDLFLGLKGQSIFGTSTGVAHFAHLGGALVGFIMMWYWKKNSFNNNRWN